MSGSCPKRDVLEQLVDGKLADNLMSTVVEHVETCRGCQEVLELITGPERLVSGVLLAGIQSDPNRLTVDRPTPDSPQFKDNSQSTTILPDIPGFELLDLLGRGGMGCVFRARHQRLNRIVALKMISAGVRADPTDRERFRNEAEALARLQHPNIVQVFEVGQHDSQQYFVMEYCPSGTLADKLGGNPMPPKDAAELTETLARAIHMAHGQNLIHRDLKPANVLLGNQGEPKVTDFGLAKDLAGASNLTEADAIVGTPSYMAPEQAAGKGNEVGPITDVWSLGAILYECLTGRPPFKAATKIETLDQVRSLDPVFPRQINPAVPRDLETIALKCLRKEPRDRYQSANEFAEDLRRFRANEPILARPIGPIGKSWKWVQRNPVAATLFAVVVVALLSVSTVSMIALRTERLRQLDSHRADARRATEQGRWVAARDAYERLTDAGGELDEQDRFERAYAQYQLGNFATARAEFEQLRSMPPSRLGQLDARVDLYLGEMLFGKDDDRARALIDSAIRKLPPTSAEANYANALIAISGRDALARFKQSEQADRFLQQARSYATYLSILFGEFDQAEVLVQRSELLYPERDDSILFRTVLAAIRGNAEAITRVQPVLAERFGAVHANGLLRSWNLLPKIGPGLAFFAGLGGENPFSNLEVVALVNEFTTRAARDPGHTLNLDLVGWPRSAEIGTPPSLRFTQRLFDTLNILANDKRIDSDLFMELATDPQKEAEFRERVDENATGLDYFVLAMVEVYRARGLNLVAFHPTIKSMCNGWVHAALDGEFQRGLARAATQFDKAARLKGLIDVRLTAFHGAVLNAGVAGSPTRWRVPDLAKQRQAAELLQDVLKLRQTAELLQDVLELRQTAELLQDILKQRQADKLLQEFLRTSEIPKNQWHIYFKIASNADDFVLMRDIAERWWKAAKQDPAASRARIIGAARSGDHYRAFELGRAYLQSTKMPDPEIKQIVDKARQELSESLKEYGLDTRVP